MTFMHLCLKRVQGSNMTGSQPHFPNYFFTVLSFSPLFSQGQSVVSTKCTSLTHLTNHANNQRPLTAFEAGPFDSRRCVQPTTISHQFMDSCLGLVQHMKKVFKEILYVYEQRCIKTGGYLEDASTTTRTWRTSWCPLICDDSYGTLLVVPQSLSPKRL